MDKRLIAELGRLHRILEAAERASGELELYINVLGRSDHTHQLQVRLTQAAGCAREEMAHLYRRALGPALVGRTA